jgi:hypothetical protein
MEREKERKNEKKGDNKWKKERMERETGRWKTKKVGAN